MANNFKPEQMARGYTDKKVAVVAATVADHTTQLAANAAHLSLLGHPSPSQIIYGLLPAKASGLTSNISAGKAYIGGNVITKMSESHTYTASKDTYIDLSVAGDFTFVETNNGGSYPALTSNCLRVAKVVSDSANIISVYPLGYNVAFGYGALSTSGGGYNTALGSYALSQNLPSGVTDSGLYNTAIGSHAMRVNTTGNHNTAVGYEAMANNTTGLNNTAIGEAALYNNIVGGSCVAIGTHAMLNCGGDHNTGVGTGSLAYLTSGTLNTAVGSDSGTTGFGASGSVTSDDRCTFIGAKACVDKSINAGPFSNSTAVGYNAIIDESNIVQLGGSSVTKVRSHGDFEAQDIGDGFVCKSPDGTRYKITVANGGTIAVAAV